MGRKKSFDTDEWYHFTARYPKAVGRALARYALDEEKDRTEIVLEFLEQVLVKGGYLKVLVKKHPETGREVRSYEVIER
jgi:hypothetical protein